MIEKRPQDIETNIEEAHSLLKDYETGLRKPETLVKKHVTEGRSTNSKARLEAMKMTYRNMAAQEDLAV